MNHEALGLPGKCYIDFLPKSRREKRNVPPVLPKRVTSPKGYKNLRDQPLETWPSDPFIMDLSYVASFSPDYKEQTTNLPDQPLNLQTSMSWVWALGDYYNQVCLCHFHLKNFLFNMNFPTSFQNEKCVFCGEKRKHPILQQTQEMHCRERSFTVVKSN